MAQPIFIEAVGSVYYDAEESASQPQLKTLVKERCSGNYRRIDRFTQLALLGAVDCVEERQLDTQSTLLVATGKGSAGIQIDMQQAIIAQREPAKPIQFINAVSNSVNFYVMRELGLKGQSLLVSRELHAFESAFALASVDPALHNARSVLLGMVDEVTHPLEDQRARLSLPPQTLLGEGSHWFLCSAVRSESALGALVENHLFANTQALEKWLSKLDGPCELYFGHGFDSSARQKYNRLAPVGSALAVESEQYWDGRSAGAAARFLRQANQKYLVTISKDTEGRCHVLRFRST